MTEEERRKVLVMADSEGFRILVRYLRDRSNQLISVEAVRLVTESPQIVISNGFAGMPTGPLEEVKQAASVLQAINVFEKEIQDITNQ